MIKFNRKELVEFARAVGQHVDEDTVVVLVGGAAASLGYGASVKTADIDIYKISGGATLPEIVAAGGEAAEETGLGIGIGSSPVADLPYNFEDRLRPVRDASTEHLAFLVPDKYDLALSKAVRGLRHDVDAIAGIHANHPLALKTLVTRFEKEMDAAIKDKRVLQGNMVSLVSRLYGMDEARALAERWAMGPPWTTMK